VLALPGLQILSHRLAEHFHHVAGLLGWLELTDFACGTRWVWGAKLRVWGALPPSPPCTRHWEDGGGSSKQNQKGRRDV